MPHDGHPAHDHPPHDLSRLGHNHVGPLPPHLHSHPHGDDAADDLRDLAASFIEGFRAADDKISFLRLAGVPFELAGEGGAPSLKLVEIGLSDDYQVATASPGFASRELVYLPFHGSMVAGRTNMVFVYVSLDERRDVDLRDFLKARVAVA